MHKDETGSGVETPRLSFQEMTKLTSGKLTDGVINHLVPLSAHHPPTKKESPAHSAVNPRSSPPQLCTSKPVSPTLTMEATEATVPRTSKRRLGVGPATRGYSNKKFKVPAQA